MGKCVLDGQRNPVNRVAARVLKPGEHYEPQKIKLMGDSDLPLPVRALAKLDHNQRYAVTALVGHRFGRLTVIGYADIQSAGKKAQARYVVRCSCGVYTYRTRKAILNPRNALTDSCDNCRHLLFIQKRDHWMRTGLDVEYNAVEGLLYDQVKGKKDAGRG